MDPQNESKWINMVGLWVYRILSYKHVKTNHFDPNLSHPPRWFPQFSRRPQAYHHAKQRGPEPRHRFPELLETWEIPWCSNDKTCWSIHKWILVDLNYITLQQICVAKCWYSMEHPQSIEVMNCGYVKLDLNTVEHCHKMMVQQHGIALLHLQVSISRDSFFHCVVFVSGKGGQGLRLVQLPTETRQTWANDLVLLSSSVVRFQPKSWSKQVKMGASHDVKMGFPNTI